MTKFVSSKYLIALAAVITSTVMAADPLAGVAGYDPAGGGDGGLSATAVEGNAYTITMTGVIGVSFDDLKGLTPMKKAVDVPTKKQVGLYALPLGTMIYAMPLGREWGAMTDELNGIDVTKAKASGKLDGGTVTMTFQKGEERCRVVTWVGVLPDGQRVWPSHPAAWSTKNVNGSPMTGWCFDGSKVVKLDQATRTALAAKK
jgi:hypothetical protein